ncbi:MAG: hypothetical protein Q8P67_01565 [archaeon]|nr:hypothetical protein [archaeon]
MLDPDYDPGLICRTLEDQMARVKSLGSAAVVIPPNIDECFKFISRSFLQSPGLYESSLSLSLSLPLSSF